MTLVPLRLLMRAIMNMSGAFGITVIAAYQAHVGGAYRDLSYFNLRCIRIIGLGVLCAGILNKLMIFLWVCILCFIIRKNS